MRRSILKGALVLSGLSTAMAVTWMMGVAYGEADKASQATYVSSDKATFKEVITGVSKAPCWGDDAMGAYGAFTKFAPGVDNGMHTHSNDIWLVVLKGAYLYKDEAGEKRVGPGEFIRVPGGHKHWSGGDKTEGALFYEESGAKFDIVPAK
jgi:mannose-6-phosphate isomerase-like protein (cupin superfamily)